MPCAARARPRPPRARGRRAFLTSCAAAAVITLPPQPPPKPLVPACLARVPTFFISPPPHIPIPSSSISRRPDSACDPPSPQISSLSAQQQGGEHATPTLLVCMPPPNFSSAPPHPVFVCVCPTARVCSAQHRAPCRFFARRIRGRSLSRAGARESSRRLPPLFKKIPPLCIITISHSRVNLHSLSPLVPSGGRWRWRC